MFWARQIHVMRIPPMCEVVLMPRPGLLCDCALVLVWDGRMDFSSFWIIHGMSQIVNPCIYNLSASLVWSPVNSNVSFSWFCRFAVPKLPAFSLHALPASVCSLIPPQAVGVVPAK